MKCGACVLNRSPYDDYKSSCKLFSTRNESGRPDRLTDNEPEKEASTHFGYENVPLHEKEHRVRKVFENVAESYDVMNDLMSGGLHHVWKDELLSMTGVEPITNVLRSYRNKDDNKHYSRKESMDSEEFPGSLYSILDVAGGTGDVAFRFVEAARCSEHAKSSGKDDISVTVCDINFEMLKVGKRRARDRFGDVLLDDTKALSFKLGNAQCLPFDEDSFDLYTIAFGLRNVTDVDMALRDAFRVLKPGGRFMCLEFSRVTNPLLMKLYETYSFNVIPAIGELVSNDRASYQYLVESIRKFSNQDELLGRLEIAGFQGCKYTNMTGGIVAIHEGWKPF